LLALKTNPNDAAKYSNYGVLLKETGREEEAEKQYKFALKNDPTTHRHTA
jgi:Flp pilus assembly protein TadD